MRVGDRDRSLLVSEADILVKFMSLSGTYNAWTGC